MDVVTHVVEFPRGGGGEVGGGVGGGVGGRGTSI